jgi:RNA polymerase sigma-70 factor (ECF subfamily)
MRDFERFSDEELAVFLSRSDTAAFEEIFNRYWSKLYATAYKRIRNSEAAEEIVQDLFTFLWDKRTDTHIHTSLSAYLFTSIRYRVLNYLEKVVVRESYKHTLIAAEALYDNSTEETVFLNDLARNIAKEVNHLPPKCRSVFELSRKGHKTNREIAEVLGISEKTVENHLTRALRQLKLGITDLSRLASWLF